MTILFLDFDGVLHPPEVHNTSDGPELLTHGKLFMHARHLEDTLGYHPEVKIVLSTSWVCRMGNEATLSYMPAKLRARVVGTTWRETQQVGTYSFDSQDRMTRFQQIWSYVYSHQIKNWLALDDLHSNTEQWPSEHKNHLILCNGKTGLGDAEVLAALNTALLERQYG
jgi:hypothetical protein